MLLRNEIRNYQVYSALPAELRKTSREYYTLAALKYSFPERFSCLHKAEAPDLQDSNGVLGVEVTWGGSPEDEQISSESVKYSRAKTAAEKEKCLAIIRKNGGNRNEISTSFPLGTAENDKRNVIESFRKKLGKADRYRQQFQHIGLVILLDIPLFFFTDKYWGKWLSDLNQGSFDFVALLHWSGVDIYDFITGEYAICRIDREDMDALKKLGRMAAEGIVKDDDPVWDN